MRSAVVMLSGGLDSCVAANQARWDCGITAKLYAITFSYGQRHTKEVEAAASIAGHLGCENWQLLELPLAELIKSSSLINQEIEVPSEGLSDSIPNTWVPQRNSIFLALSMALAEEVDADAIYTGFNIRDYSGYPDCRPEFVEAISKALNLASKRYVETGKGIRIETPLINKTKVEIVAQGFQLDAPLHLTWSCYKGLEKACGVCDSCRIRLEAFKVLGKEDPVEYM